MKQKEFNDNVMVALDVLTSTLSLARESNQGLLDLIQFTGNRVESAENRLDILMSDRGGLLAEASKKFDCAIDDHLEQVENQTITPKSLLGIGFSEMYQEPEPGVPGFIYYTFDRHGLDLTSTDVGGIEPFHVVDSTGFVVVNFSKLKALVEALRELE